MDHGKKLKILEELDSTTDWEALVKEHGKTSQIKISVKELAGPRKLTKSEKKRAKLERQRQQVEETLKRKNVKTLVYNNPDAVSSRRNKVPETGSVTANEQKGIEIDMNKARHEIVKFGMQSLTAKALEDAEAALAIRLGAKPSKKQAVNYKELQIQRKKEKEHQKEMEATMMKPKLLKRNMKSKKKPGGSMKPGKERITGHQRGGRASGRNSQKTSRRQRNN